ncbi:hypothetical protein RRG08_060209 [Elysia crispata]|uniref:Uncharacterized protein n=1 Tax=Elysia crispata TaxID=231223 RepID=A0AAE0YLU7_9GAST|nr:hypothetical protein RRG08_060209 [Elysia crispata]
MNKTTSDKTAATSTYISASQLYVDLFLPSLGLRMTRLCFTFGDDPKSLHSSRLEKTDLLHLMEDLWSAACRATALRTSEIFHWI